MKALVYAVLTLLVAACGGDMTERNPPQIHMGRDMCLECGMIISDPRYAAAYEYEGDDRFFDDIGDLIAYGLRNGELSATIPVWVHDYHSEAWLPAAEASFVMASDFATPMGHGITAFVDPKDAAAFSEGFGGAVLTWEDLLARPPAGEISHKHEG